MPESIVSSLINILLSIPGILFAFTLKGYAQAAVAKLLGDPTPEAQGRLTMNPLAHIDIVGFICIILFRFGWSKPVPTNSRYYKNIKRDKTIQILSGPLGLIAGGFIMSFFSVLLMMLSINVFPDNIILEYLATVFSYAMVYPILLASFYMLPLPGLDGWDLITNFLPYSCNRVIYNIEKYSMFIFLGFILIVSNSMLGSMLYAPAYLFIGLLEKMWSFLLGFIF